MQGEQAPSCEQTSSFPVDHMTLHEALGIRPRHMGLVFPSLLEDPVAYRQRRNNRALAPSSSPSRRQSPRPSQILAYTSNDTPWFSCMATNASAHDIHSAWVSRELKFKSSLQPPGSSAELLASLPQPVRRNASRTGPQLRASESVHSR